MAKTIENNNTNLHSVKGYSGIYNCHKYWGKKPVELYELILDKFSKENDVVCDPFMGSGVLPSVCKVKGVNFIGCDLNPAAIDVANFFINPPNKAEVKIVLDKIKSACEDKINKTYQLKDGTIVTHIVWIENEIDEIWTKNGKRIELIDVTEENVNTLKAVKKRKIQFFKDRELSKNSRINVDLGQKVSDLFTERALSNIDIILEFIESLEENEKRIARFILSSALGQMSKMVFTIGNRKKSKLVKAKERKYEVGSWVIGYWRPKTYFEINVFEVFYGRAKRLFNAVKEEQSELFNKDASKKSEISIECVDAVKKLKKLKDETLDVVITDPPHSDRIPYLELSEMWNTFLGYKSSFKEEFIYSNSTKRSKSLEEYKSKFKEIFEQIGRVLKVGGVFILIFNTTDDSVWDFIESSIKDNAYGLIYEGRFSADYSANSVVQDNRDGALTNDWCLVISKNKSTNFKKFNSLNLPSWTKEWV